jgi:hypothetical protein
MDPLTFATGLRDRGIEFVNERLRVWPAKAYAYFTAAEREYIRAHRPELKELVRTRAVPESVVVWQPPGDAGLPLQAVPIPSTVELAPAPESPRSVLACPYCYQVPCIGDLHPAFRTLHFRDPVEVKRRSAKATAVAKRMTRLGHWSLNVY